MVDGEMKQLLVHRKGSTRAFPPHHPLIPVDYQLTGQPVLIGGTMGTNSYVLTGGLHSCPTPPPTLLVKADRQGKLLSTLPNSAPHSCKEYMSAVSTCLQSGESGGKYANCSKGEKRPRVVLLLVI